MLPRIVTKDSRLQVFQYKLLNNVLYLNKMLFKFGKIDSPLCPFCKMIEETPLHLFYNCIKTKLLWDQLRGVKEGLEWIFAGFFLFFLFLF